MTSDLVTVGVDGCTSNQAVRWAIEYATSRSAPIEFVHALPAPGRGATESVGDRRHKGLRVVQREVALAHEAGLSRVGICLADEPVSAALVGASQRAGLLVIGRRDTASRIYRRSPSVSRHLSRYASCPVVVVPESMPHNDEEKRIVLLLNGVVADHAAFDFAYAQATATGAEIELIEADAASSTVREVLAAADHADLVVIPGRVPTDDMLGGGDPELVALRHAPCPVVYAR